MSDDIGKIEAELESERSKITVMAARSHQVTIKLSSKIKLNGIAVDSISLRRPTANDYIQVQTMKATDGEMERALIARLAGAPPEEVGECNIADWSLCQAALQGFSAGRAS